MVENKNPVNYFKIISNKVAETVFFDIEQFC